MRTEPTDVKISNSLPTGRLLNRITGKIAHLKEVSAEWAISGFGFKLSGHFHRTTAKVSERNSDDGR